MYSISGEQKIQYLHCALAIWILHCFRQEDTVTCGLKSARISSRYRHQREIRVEREVYTPLKVTTINSWRLEAISRKPRLSLTRQFNYSVIQDSVRTLPPYASKPGVPPQACTLVWGFFTGCLHSSSRSAMIWTFCWRKAKMCSYRRALHFRSSTLFGDESVPYRNKLKPTISKSWHSSKWPASLPSRLSAPRGDSPQGKNHQTGKGTATYTS